MLIQFPPEVSAMADRRDFDSLPPRPSGGAVRGLIRFAQTVAVFFAATFALAVLLFLPVLAVSLTSVEAVDIAGRIVPASAFADRLQDLFWGGFIVALAVTSFIAGARLSPSGPIIRPHYRDPDPQEPQRRAAALRVIGWER